MLGLPLHWPHYGRLYCTGTAQQEHVRTVGAETYRQRYPEPQLEPNKTQLSCKGIILHYMSSRVLVLPAQLHQEHRHA
ncbi:Uncharacterized protein HZ326_29330 [Fusarium oxysporum f. sp. albedinis]|nr:Uncharacterized protein HZ326_29330 [Fusarium oxysporum f. sp. albedinis]